MKQYSYKFTLPTFGSVQRKPENAELKTSSLFSPHPFQAQTELSENLNLSNTTQLSKQMQDIRERTSSLQASTISFQKQILLHFDKIQSRIQELKHQKQYYQNLFEEQKKEIQICQAQKEKYQNDEIREAKKLVESLSLMNYKITNQHTQICKIADWAIDMINDYYYIKENSVQWKEAYDFLQGQHSSGQ